MKKILFLKKLVHKVAKILAFFKPEIFVSLCSTKNFIRILLVLDTTIGRRCLR